MDKKSIIGFVLIAAILGGYMYFTRPSEAEVARMQRMRDSIAEVQARSQREKHVAEAEHMQRDSLRWQGGAVALDSIFTVPEGSSEFHLENDKLNLTISSLGANIREALVRGYRTSAGDSLRLFYGAGNGMRLNFFAKGIPVSTDQLNFALGDSTAAMVARREGDTARLSLVAQAHGGGQLVVDYKLGYGSYMPSISIALRNMRNVLAPNRQSIDLQWYMRSPQQEKDIKKEIAHTKLCYALPNGDFEEMACSDQPESESIKTRVDWVAFKEQFFSAILVNRNGFEQADLEIKPSEEQGILREFSANFMLPLDARSSTTSYQFDLYLGPNLYPTLEAYGHGFEQVVPLGGWIIGWVNKYIVINVFDWLSRYISNYGLIILILTILIKMLLFPLTFKSYKSQAKMRVLKPLVDEINEKFPKQEDAMKKQQAIMSLYKRAGASPMGGCLPMLIQMPILIAMFRFFPSSFELRQKSFLWATDLSTYDSIYNLPFDIPFYGNHISLFTLLMAVAMYFSSLLNYKNSPQGSTQMPGMKFMMLYMMPIMMVFWFNDYSAGLSYYYFLAMMITILQTLVIRKTINEKKLFERLQHNAQKNSGKQKKSGFMQRLEKMQREQARQQELRRKGK